MSSEVSTSAIYTKRVMRRVCDKWRPVQYQLKAEDSAVTSSPSS